MGRQLRFFESNTTQFVTCRCFQGRFLMRPSAEVNALIGGVLVKALSNQPEIKVYAFTFLSNHFHMLVEGPDYDPCSIAKFIGYVKSNIARAVGRVHQWRGNFFERRYSAEPVLDDGALIERMHYIYLNGIKEGLVERVEEWPGLTSLPEHLGQVREFAWYDRTAWHKAGRTGEIPKTLYKMRVAPLERKKTKTPVDTKTLVNGIVAEINANAAKYRGTKRLLGRAGVLAQDPHAAPRKPERSPRPHCHVSGTKEEREDAINAQKEKYKVFETKYQVAAQKTLIGDGRADYPKHCFRPVLPQNWKIVALPLEKPIMIRLEWTEFGYEGILEILE